MRMDAALPPLPGGYQDLDLGLALQRFDQLGITKAGNQLLLGPEQFQHAFHFHAKQVTPWAWTSVG